MGPIFSRRNLLISLLASSSLLSAPALGQQTVAAPPEYIEPDASGTDVISGTASLDIQEGSIGSGPGAIEIRRIFGGDNYWADNWSGGLFQSADFSQWIVSLGSTSDRFIFANGVFTPTQPEGTSLSQSGSIYTYRAADGTQIEYQDPGQDGSFCSGNASITCKVPVSITKPNGLKFRLSWQQVTKCVDTSCVQHWVYSRLSAITSSAGYRADFSYLTADSGGTNGINPDWLQRSGVVLNNSVTPITQPPSIGYSYSSNQSVNVTDPGGRIWAFTTDSEGRLATVRRPGSASDNRVYTYDAAGDVATATIDGVATSYSRTSNGNLLTVTATNPLNQQTATVVDTTIGRPISETVGGQTTTYAYDAYGRRTRVTEPEGNYTQLTYDGRGNVTEVRKVAKAGSGLADIVTTASSVPPRTFLPELRPQ